HGIFLFIIVGLWQLSEMDFRPRRLARLAAGLALGLAAALATVPVVWPYYRHGFLSRYKETFATFSNHQYNEYVFYLGRHIRAHEVPWHFPFVMLGVNTPLVIDVFMVFALGVLAWRLLHPSADRSPLVLCALWFFVPVCAQAFSGAVKLDGVR